MSDRAVILASELLQLGVSRVGVTELLAHYPEEQIERQLLYLQFRNAKRPGAFIVEAIRRDYSPPKEFFYAQNNPARSKRSEQLDQNSKPPA
ncbi:MAG TPA: hypothetical protein VGL56_04455 [Fimbriimonadaceae bacterium]|jgi:hypothetical protein